MVGVKKQAFILLAVLAVSMTFLSYFVLANAEAIRENIGADTTPIVAKINVAQINFEERMKNIRGSLLSANETLLRVFEKLVGSEKKEFLVELVEPVTPQGTHMKINGEAAYMPSGGTKYANGWLVRHRGNIKNPSGAISSNIDAIYVGPDAECGLAEHYECIDGNLHWLYCNGTDYGIVEECDSCRDNECIKKGTFARWERLNALIQNNSVTSD